MITTSVIEHHPQRERESCHMSKQILPCVVCKLEVLHSQVWGLILAKVAENFIYKGIQDHSCVEENLFYERDPKNMQ